MFGYFIQSKFLYRRLCCFSHCIGSHCVRVRVCVNVNIKAVNGMWYLTMGTQIREQSCVYWLEIRLSYNQTSCSVGCWSNEKNAVVRWNVQKVPTPNGVWSSVDNKKHKRETWKLQRLSTVYVNQRTKTMEEVKKCVGWRDSTIGPKWNCRSGNEINTVRVLRSSAPKG